jgi:hypothetical protein
MPKRIEDGGITPQQIPLPEGKTEAGPAPNLLKKVRKVSPFSSVKAERGEGLNEFLGLSLEDSQAVAGFLKKQDKNHWEKVAHLFPLDAEKPALTQAKQLKALIDLAQAAYPFLDRPTKQNLKEQVGKILIQSAPLNQLTAAEALIEWQKKTYRQDRTIEPKKTNGGSRILYESATNQPPIYLPRLLEILEPAYFDQLGGVIKQVLSEKTDSLSPASLKHRDKSGFLANCSAEVLSGLTECFVEAGFVGHTKKNKFRLTSRGKKTNHLDYEALKSVSLAAQLLSLPKEKGEIGSLEDIQSLYEGYRQEVKVASPEFILNQPSRKVLYLADVLFGHKDLDMDFLIQAVNQIKAMPEKLKPDLIVVSGLVQGGFQFLEKSRRAALAGDFSSVNLQFQAARLLIEELRGLGVPIIYNLADEDMAICHNYTIEALRMLRHWAKPLGDRDKNFLTYWQIDQLKQTRAWDFHLNFQIEVVFPYCLRSGRRLRSADEVESLTGGELRIEEYLALYEARRILISGGTLPPEYRRILDVDNIPLPGKNFGDFLITDGLNLQVSTTNEKYLSTIRHNLKFSASPRYQNPIDVSLSIAGQIQATGEKFADELVTQHQGIGLGIKAGNTWAILTPPLQRPDLNQKSSIFGVNGDPTRRQITTRRFWFSPGVTMHEFRDDGRYAVDILNETLLDKSDSPNRVTMAFPMDWQEGSITARPDLQVKFMDYLFSEILPDHPLYMVFAGDIIQGRNYVNMPNENFSTLLIPIDRQAMFVSNFLERELRHIPQSHWGNVQLIGVVPGNHELNSGFWTLGASHSHYLVDLFRKYMPETGKVKFYDGLETTAGDYLKTFTGFEPDIANYGVYIQHLILEKGAKGGGGERPPIYQALELFQGINGLAKNIDFAVFGHWHHPMYGLFGDKVAVVGPALAGLSAYELLRAYRPEVGALLLHLGGKLPPTIDFLSKQTLLKHEIKDGYFSAESLADHGFQDSPGFDVSRHGFANRGLPQSALQKALWQMVDEITYPVKATLA